MSEVNRAAEAKWRPIATAPQQNGNAVIGWCKQWTEPTIIDWDGREGTWMTPHVKPLHPPTHWMPLPAAPGGAEEGKEVHGE